MSPIYRLAIPRTSWVHPTWLARSCTRNNSYSRDDRPTISSLSSEILETSALLKFPLGNECIWITVSSAWFLPARERDRYLFLGWKLPRRTSSTLRCWSLSVAWWCLPNRIFSGEISRNKHDGTEWHPLSNSYRIAIKKIRHERNMSFVALTPTWMSGTSIIG